jgi:hypothetical protein
MAKKVYTDLDLDQVSTINQGGFEKIAGDAPTPVDGQEWYNTTSDKRKVHIDTTTQVYAFESWVTAEINKLERIQGSFDASAGLLPNSGNKTQGDLTQIVPGDYWIISVGGTIAGIGGDDVLAVGDKLQYVGGGAGTASNWVGIQTNLNDANIGTVKKERQTVNLVANTPLTVTAATIADIHSVQVYNSAGLEIVVNIDRSGAANTRILTSKKSLTGVVVELLG